MTTESIRIDPFTLEVIRDSLQAACDEMFVALRRTAMSAVIYEVLDFGVGITDAQGRLVAQGNGITVFIGVLESCVQSVVRKFGPTLRAGDVYISNDPFAGGGTHLNDVCLVMPVVIDGAVVAFTAAKAHWTDIGGSAPGSISVSATELFQEGLVIPDLRIIAAGTPDPTVFDLITANTRLPERTNGDLWASIAAARTGANRVVELTERFGLAALCRAMDSLIAYGAEVARQAVRTLPSGTFSAEEIVPDFSPDGEPLQLRASVTITGEQVIVDLRGNPPQRANPFNCTFVATVAAVRSVFVALAGPHSLVNHGSFEPLGVLADEGSIFAARPPAAVGLYGEPLSFAVDLVWRALAPQVPNRLGAGHFLAVAALIIAGPHADNGEFRVAVGPQAGGWGADAEGDGASALFQCLHGATQNMPVEVFEANFGLRVLRYALNPGPGGEGRYCGGKGVCIEYLVRADAMSLSALGFSRNRVPAWGMSGGRDGSVSTVRILHPDGSTTDCPRANGTMLRRGDIVQVWTGNGGGYGDPRLREAGRIEADLKNGYVTRKQAIEVFGYLA